MPTSEDRGFHPTKVTSTRHVVPADFHEFPDGTLIELIANASSPTGLSFVVFENGGPDIRDSYIHGEEVFEPALPTSRWARSLELPHGFGPKLPYKELFANVAAAINCFVDVDHVSLGQLAAFVLATWLPGLGSTAPFVLIVGPVGSGKTTLLKVLSCMCRRSLMIAGATARQIQGLPMSLHPTLLFDEMELDRNFCRLMRLSHTAHIPTFYKDQPLDFFGPKVINCREMPADEALVSRCVQVTLAASSKAILPLSDAMMQKIRTTEVPGLLRFRLENYFKRERPQILPDQLTPRTLDLANTLMSVPELGSCTSMILNGLKQQDEDRIVDRGISEHGLLLEQLLVLCHTGAPTVLVGEFANLVNLRMQLLGQSKRYKAREIGAKLRTMGLFAARTNAGYAVPLWGEGQRKIHKLAITYGLTDADTARCALCSKPVAKVPTSEHSSKSLQWNGTKMTRNCRRKRRSRGRNQRSQA